MSAKGQSLDLIVTPNVAISVERILTGQLLKDFYTIFGLWHFNEVMLLRSLQGHRTLKKSMKIMCMLVTNMALRFEPE